MAAATTASTMRPVSESPLISAVSGLRNSLLKLERERPQLSHRLPRQSNDARRRSHVEVSQPVVAQGPDRCHVTARGSVRRGYEPCDNRRAPRSGDIDVLSRTTELFELIENHLGKAFVKVQQAMQVQVPMMQPPSPSNP